MVLQVEKVIYELVRCIALSRLVYGDHNWHLARAHTKLASAYFDLKGSFPFYLLIVL